MKEVQQYIESNHTGAVERLKEFLAIPSVSTDPAYKQNVDTAAKWVATFLKDAGMNAQIKPSGKNGQGHQVVFASTSSDQVRDQAAGRVLFYGHYDVQPPEPLDKWTTAPFEPEIRDGNIYARGACDDKGQVACFLESLAAYKATGNKFPCHITVLIEGEEECGSENLPEFITKNKKDLQADIALISDTTMWTGRTGGAVPAICYALRGLLYFDVQLHGPKRDLHSGVYGGTLANPATVLTQALGRLFDKNQRITVPGFYDDVAPLTADEKGKWRQLDFDEKSFLSSVGAKEPFGEAGYSTLQRRWTRPACDINGLYGGYQGHGAKTVIPTCAGAKVSFRLAANQDPDKIAGAFKSWLKSQETHGLDWQITEHGRAHPVAISTQSPWITAASCAIEEICGAPPALVREGATIPIVGDFKKILGLDSLLIGFGLDSDAIHSPNEHFGLDRFLLGCKTHAALLAHLASVKQNR